MEARHNGEGTKGIFPRTSGFNSISVGIPLPTRGKHLAYRNVAFLFIGFSCPHQIKKEMEGDFFFKFSKSQFSALFYSTFCQTPASKRVANGSFEWIRSFSTVESLVAS